MSQRESSAATRRANHQRKAAERRLQRVAIVRQKVAPSVRRRRRAQRFRQELRACGALRHACRQRRPRCYVGSFGAHARKQFTQSVLRVRGVERAPAFGIHRDVEAG